MKYLTVIFASISYLCFNPTNVSAQVYKCKGADGKIAYQQVPCPAGQQETRPTIMRGPTLTDEERFNAAAYAEGMTPAEARRLLEDRGSAQDKAGPIQPRAVTENSPPPSIAPRDAAYRCTKLDGRSYVSNVPCPERARVTTDPRSGAGFSALVTEEVVDRRQACQEARTRRDQSEREHRARGSRIPDDYRRRLDQSVSDLCR